MCNAPRHWFDPEDDWVQQVRQHGHWHEPEWWLAPDNLAHAPYGQHDLERAFTQLQQLYPAEILVDVLRQAPEDREALRAYEHQHPIPFALAGRLVCALGNPTALVGVDLADALPDSRRLHDRLRDRRAYAGARWELAVMAALRRANISYEFEPCEDQPGPNPDFLVHQDGGPLYWECKSPRVSHQMLDAWEDTDQLREQILSGLDGVSVELEVLPDLRELRRTSGSRARFTDLLRQVGCEAVQTIRDAANRGQSNGTVRDLVGYTITAVSDGFVQAGSLAGFDHDERVEARRVIQKAVEEAESQIPHDALGIALVELNVHVNVAFLEEAILAYFSDASQSDMDLKLAGVLFTFDSIADRERTMVRLVRNPAHESAFDATVGGAFADALNRHKDQLHVDR